MTGSKMDCLPATYASASDPNNSLTLNPAFVNRRKLIASTAAIPVVACKMPIKPCKIKRHLTPFSAYYMYN